MKYIDADRLRAAIEEKYKSEIQPWLSGVSATSAIYDYVLPLIDSLQQEQPDLPSDLDEAARKAALVSELVGVDEEHLDEYPYSPIAEQKFKDGAERIAGRGVSMVIADETKWADVDIFVHRNCDGASIIQIRKKD